MKLTDVIKRAVFGLFVLQLAACSTLPELQQVTPGQISYRQSAELHLHFDSDPQQLSVALSPSVVSTAHTLPLPKRAEQLGVLADGSLLIGVGNSLQHWLLSGEVPIQLEVIKLEGVIKGLAASQKTVVLADGNGLLSGYELAEGRLQPIYQQPFGHEIARMTQWGDQLAILTTDGRLALVSPQQRLEAPLGFAATAVACQNHLCYLATPAGVEMVQWQHGQWHRHGRYSVSGGVNDLQLRDDHLYLAGEMGFSVVDISQPLQPRWFASNNKFGSAQRLQLSNNLALLQDGQGQIVVIDLAMPRQPIWQSSFKAAPNAPFVLAEQLVWVADAAGLKALDVSNAVMPPVNSAGVNLGGSRRVALRDDTLYVADWFSGLHLYDISIPQQPHHVGNVHTPGSAKGVLLYGDIAYVGDDDHGLQVVDLTAEQVVAKMPTPGLAYAMDRVGNLLYLADHRGGFHIIDIADPRLPAILGSYDTQGKVWALQVYQQHALVTDDRHGLLIFDVADPRQPKPVASFAPGGFAEDVLIRDHYAYVAFFDQGLFILDIRDPANPKQLAHLPIPGNARGLFLQDDLLYIADWDAGLQLVDVSDSQAPRWVGGIDTPGAAWGVVVQQDYAYVMDWWGGVQTIDVSDPVHPVQRDNYHARDEIADVALAENYAYTVSPQGGLQVFDVRNIEGPIWVTGLDLAGARQVVLNEGMAYVALGEQGMAVVDIRNPFYARLVQQAQRLGAVEQLALGDGQLFVLDRQGQVTVAYWQTGQWQKGPTLAGRYQTLTVADGLILLLDQAGKLRLLDAETLTRQSAYQAAGPISHALMRDGVIYLVDQQGTVELLRWHNQQLRQITSWSIGEAVADMALQGQTLYLNGHESGLFALDVSNPQRPVLTYHYPRMVEAGGLAVSERVALFSGNPRLATAALLPSFTQQVSRDGIELQLPGELPLGDYDLLVSDGQRRQRYPAALQVVMPKGKRSTFTLEDLRETLKKQQRLPTQP